LKLTREKTPARNRSSFGEYNPGGGKEQVRKYLLLCQEQVIKSKGSLESIIKLLKL
jgi:Ca2+ transporting ATPase